MKYNDPNTTASSIGSEQFETFKWQKKALVEMKKKQYFTPLANTKSMPKHFGKKMKLYHVLPMMDDANINDQGIDANGVSTTVSVTIVIRKPDSKQNIYTDHYAVGEGATQAAALTAAKAEAESVFKNLEVFTTSYAATKTALTGLADPWIIDDTGNAVPNTGNLYGSSKDVGTILNKIPRLDENGGRKNRVGFTRISIEGSLEKYGIFREYTKESMDFDSDSELGMHITREMLYGANEITEDILQIDLLASAGVVRYGGNATSKSTITGEGANISVLSYKDFMKMAIDLSNNRTPKQTTVITGSRMQDTKTVSGGYIMYVGSELIPQLRSMVDQFGKQAFIDIKHYSDATTPLNGEIGSIDQFRIIEVPEMLHYAGAGDTVTTNGGYRETGGRYDAYPMLAVGSDAFSTIGFQTDGKTVKFKIKHSKPEDDISYNRNDPYGELGFMSIKWYYGFLLERPERIALALTVAEW